MNDNTYGLFSATDSSLKLSEIYIGQNQAMHGSCIFGFNSSILLIDSKIECCYSSGNGGAIYVYDGNISLLNIIFFSNSAQLGGDIYLTGKFNATLDHIKSSKSMASIIGKCIYADGTGIITVNRSQFNYHIEEEAIYCEDGVNITFDNNRKPLLRQNATRNINVIKYQQKVKVKKETHYILFVMLSFVTIVVVLVAVYANRAMKRGKVEQILHELGKANDTKFK